MKKCRKCGIEYPDNIKFCSECGGQVVPVPQVQTYTLHCKSCNGTMTIEDDRPVLSCPFCGSKELIAESDAVTVERIKQKTHREIEMGKQQLERERMQYDYKVAEEQKKANEIRKFRKSFMGVMLIIVTVLSVLFCAVSFNDSRILSGIVAIIMGVLCVASYLMGLQVIKEKFKGMRIISAILAFVLIIPYFSLYNGAAPSYEDQPEDFEWTILEMHEYLPEPPSTYGTIGLDYDDHLSIDVYKISYAEYKEYRNECIDFGYDKDTSGGGDTYDAYNDEGFSLNLFYYEDNEKLGIILLAPEEETESTKADETETSTPAYKIDYYDAASFEKALNNGTKVNGKIVQFDVLEYKPNSALGVNCWSGEHLNFISKEEINVDKGSVVIGRVTTEPTKTLGSWKIPYEVLSISGDKIDDNTTDETTLSETKISMSADSSTYAGKQKADVEKELKDKGFTNISIHEVMTTDSNNPDGQVTSVSATNDSFKKGDKFEKDAEIIIYCWKYEKPQSEYEKAYIRDMSNYDLYYMFDTDKKAVVYFGTNDTYIEKGTYTGDFATGVTITWSHGEWTEKFTHKSGRSATLIDGSGWDWEYKVCNVEEAQKILDTLR